MTLAQIFLSPETTKVICGAIFLFFLWQTFRFIHLIGILNKELNDFSEFLQKESSADNLALFFSETGKNFRALWEQYEAVWVKIDSVELPIFKNKLYSTESSARFFNENNCLESKLNMDWFHAIPSILTGLGILFTFLGLVLGLSQGGPSNTAITTDFYKNIFHGAAIAFWSSVVGLITSVIFTAITKSMIFKTVSRLDSITNRLDTLIPIMTPQKISLFTLATVRRSSDYEEGIKEQFSSFSQAVSTSLKDLLTDLTKEFSESLDKKIQASADMFKNSADMFKNSAEEIGKSLTSLSETVCSFNKQLKEAGDAVLLDFKEAEDRTKNALKNLEETNNQFLAILQENLNTVEKSFKELTLTHADQVKKDEAEFLEIRRNLSDELEQCVADSVKKFSEANDSFISLVRNNMEEIKKEFVEFSGFNREQIKNTEKEFVQSRENLILELSTQTQNIASQFSTQIGDAISSSENSLTKAFSGITAELDNSLNSFKDLTTVFPRICNEIKDANEALLSDAGKVRSEFVSQIKDQTKSSTELIENTISKLYEINEKVMADWVSSSSEYSNKFTQNFERSFNEMNSSIQNCSNLVNKINALIHDQLNISDSLLEANQKFSNMANKIPELFTAISKIQNEFVSQSSSLQLINDKTASVLSSIDSASDVLNNACHELSNHIQSIPLEFDNLSTRNAQNFENHLQAVDEHLTSALRFLGESVEFWIENQKEVNKYLGKLIDKVNK